MLVSQKQLAAVFGVDPRTIRRWEEDGMPREDTGEYRTSDCIAWRIDQESPSDAKEAYAIARARREEARAVQAELDVEERSGRLLPVNVVHEIYGGMVDNLRAAIQNLTGRWATNIVGLESPREASVVLRDVSSELLEHLSGPVADALESGRGSEELPDDFPGIGPLREAGVRTYAHLAGLEDLTSIHGVGPATERKILEALEDEHVA